jgi:hypothetical protein
MDTHKGIDLDLVGKGQTSTSSIGWSMDTVFDSQTLGLKAYPFREDNRRTGTSDFPGLSDKVARFLSGSFSPYHKGDKSWDPFR